MNRPTRVRPARRLAAVLPWLVLLLTGTCKWGPPDYTLNVTIGNGITGTPEPGQHVYQELTTVTLAYTPVNPLHTVEVWINGTARQTGSSSLVMYDDYQLSAQLVDVRGSYKVTLTYLDSSVTAPDPFLITLDGPDLVSGTFSDERGYHGTWTATATALTLAYWDWSFYVLSTTVYDMGHNSGTFTGGGLSGTWTSVKQ
jgi:hypothetical protein